MSIIFCILFPTALSTEPDKSFIDAVNSPFSCFEPIELEENITEELLAHEIDSFDKPVSTNDNLKDELPENIKVIDTVIFPYYFTGVHIPGTAITITSRKYYLIIYTNG